MTDYEHLGEMRDEKMIGVIELTTNLSANFSNFLPNFRKTLVNKNDKEDLLTAYAEAGGKTSQPSHLASHYKLER